MQPLQSVLYALTYTCRSSEHFIIIWMQ